MRPIKHEWDENTDCCRRCLLPRIKQDQSRYGFACMTDAEIASVTMSLARIMGEVLK